VHHRHSHQNQRERGELDEGELYQFLERQHVPVFVGQRKVGGLNRNVAVPSQSLDDRGRGRVEQGGDRVWVLKVEDLVHEVGLTVRL